MEGQQEIQVIIEPQVFKDPVNITTLRVWSEEGRFVFDFANKDDENKDVIRLIASVGLNLEMIKVLAGSLVKAMMDYQTAYGYDFFPPDLVKAVKDQDKSVAK